MQYNIRFIFVCVVLASSFDGFEFNDRINAVDDLRNQLLSLYNRNVRPVRNHNHNTSIELSLFLNNIHLDEHQQTLTVLCYLHITWTDEYLSWIPGSKNITSLHFDRTEIWLPDIALYNSAQNGDITPESKFPIPVSNNGEVTWVSHFNAQVPCLMDISLWPIDVQTCVLKLGSWTHNGEQISLDVPPNGKGIILHNYKENDRWKLVNYNATKKSIIYDAPYHYIKYSLTIERQAASHAIYISQTTLTVIVVVLSSYFLPLQFLLSRFLLHLFALGTLVICNIIMFVTLPATSGHIPFVVKYFSGAMVLTTLSLLCQVIMANTITQVTASSLGFRGVFRSILGFPVQSQSTINLVSEEVAYSNLQEETREASEPQLQEESRSSQATVPNKTINSTQVHDMHRVVNVVLFCMFSVSYIVDYAILRSSIGY